MARDYARIMTAIWGNKEFCNLGEGPQRMYLLLVTQPDISAAGVLRLWVPRWALMSRTSTADGLTKHLRDLEAGRFIVVDWVTGELLIRSFIRWDAGFNNPKRRPVIVRAGNEVLSENIARHLEIEFKRCGLLPDSPPPTNGGVADTPSDSVPDSLSGSPSKIDRVDLGNEPFSQVDRLTPSYALDDGLAVTYIGVEEPQPASPEPVPPAAASTIVQAIIGDWIDSCAKRPPKPVIGQASKAIKALLEEGISEEDVRGGVKIWSSKGMHAATLPSFVNEFMNKSVTPIRKNAYVNPYADADGVMRDPRTKVAIER